MASPKKSNAKVGKITFGSKKYGKARKKYGPKQQKPKKYRGQGKR
jgi:hypothetical protein